MTVKVTIDPGTRPALVTIRGDGVEQTRIEPGAVREFRVAEGRSLTVTEVSPRFPEQPK